MLTGDQFRGIVAAPFLPMLPDHAVDWETLESYIERVAAAGPTAIAMNMDASEGPALDRDEQIEVLRVSKDAIGGAARYSPVSLPARPATRFAGAPP